MRAWFVRLGVGLLAWGAGVEGAAKVKWESAAFETTLPAGREHTEGVFRFKNEGGGAVRVVAVTTSCGCVGAVADKASLAPGESGEVRMRFEAKGAVGRVAQTITVETREGEAASERHTLSVVVNVTERLTLTPRLLIWSLDGPAETRTVAVDIAATGAPEPNVQVSAAKGFTVKLTRESPLRWLVSVTPESTREEARDTLTLTLGGVGAAEVERTVYLRVR